MALKSMGLESQMTVAASALGLCAKEIFISGSVSDFEEKGKSLRKQISRREESQLK
jgi:hypothetical protein